MSAPKSIYLIYSEEDGYYEIFDTLKDAVTSKDRDYDDDGNEIGITVYKTTPVALGKYIRTDGVRKVKKGKK